MGDFDGKAAFQRRLQSGTNYDRFFPVAKLERADPIVMDDGEPTDTIELMRNLARQYQADTSGLAPLLRGKSLKETCNNIWQFAYSHFQYTPDKSGVEQLRRPLRAWTDRVAGIDCDCYSILVSTILLNLGIAHDFRMTKYGGKAEYQHIYVVVPNGGGYYTIDPVTDRFDHEESFTAKYDKQMSINGLPQQVLNGLPQQVLNGAPTAPRPLVEKNAYGAFGLSAEFVGLEAEAEQARLDTLAAIKKTSLSGLAGLLGADVVPSHDEVQALADVTGQTHEEAIADSVATSYTSASFIERMRQHLVNTVEHVQGMAPANRPAELVTMCGRIDLILKSWYNEPERTRLFTEFGDLEEAELRAAGLSGLGLGSWLSDAASSVGNAISSAAGSVVQSANWTYSSVIKPVGQAIGQATSWVTDKVVSAAKALAQGIKKAVVWAVNEALKLSKFLMKYNPVMALIRVGLKIVMRVNMFHVAGRIGHGYFSEAQAQAFGMDMDEWRKCRAQLGKVMTIWDGLSGDIDVLHDSIMIGYQSGKQPKIAAKDEGALEYKKFGLSGLGAPGSRPGLGALGEAAAAGGAVAAALALVTTIVKWLSEVDWAKLFKGAKAAATVVTAAVSAYKAVSALKLNANSALPASEAEYLANPQRYETQQVDASTDSLTLPLVIGAAALGIYAFTSSTPSKVQ